MVVLAVVLIVVGLVMFVIMVAAGSGAQRDRRSAAPELRFTVSEELTRLSEEEEEFEWVPTYHVDTPLRALLDQGKRQMAKHSDLDRFSDTGKAGHWANVRYGLRDEVWSQIGQVSKDGGAFKEFLIEFRKIVESDQETVEKIKAAEALCERSPEYEEFADRIGEDFPYTWFANRLTEINSVGPGTAMRLFDAGFIDLESLKSASDEEIKAVHGVGAGTVSEIRKHFGSVSKGGKRARFRERRGGRSSRGRAVTVDADAQPPRAINADRRINRATSELLGLIRGVLADGVVTEDEATALAEWLSANDDVVDVWPVSILSDRLEAIFEDGVIDEEERRDLEDLLRNFVGGDLGVQLGHSLPTTLPLDDPPPELKFDGSTFVFTGKFAFGPRQTCQEAVMELGATCAEDVTLGTDYLVIGTFGSRDWVQSAYGRKIEKAVRYRREKSAEISIIGEDHWSEHI